MNIGDICFVNLTGNVGHEFQGIRPTVVVSSDNTFYVTVIPITSNVNNKIPTDIFVKKNNENKLRSDSIIKTRHVYTCDLRRVITKKIGYISNEYIFQIKTYLLKLFDLK